MHRKPSSFVLSVLRHGYLRPLSPVPSRYCHNPLPVAAKGKFRLVLALRQVNAYLNVNTFRCKDLRIVAELLERNDILSRLSHMGVSSHRYTPGSLLIFGFSLGSLQHTKLNKSSTFRELLDVHFVYDKIMQNDYAL